MLEMQEMCPSEIIKKILQILINKLHIILVPIYFYFFQIIECLMWFLIKKRKKKI